MDFETVATDLEFPEGPIWCRDGSVIVVEIAGGRLTRVGADGGKQVIAELGGGPNGAAIGPDGKCYVCNNGGFAWRRDEMGTRPVGTPPDYSGGRIERVDPVTGVVETLYRADDRGPLRGPNDIVFDAHGGFWFTDPGKTSQRAADIGSVIYARADGSSICEAIYPMFRPNGIGLSPDGRFLYVAETPTGRIWRFALTGPGEIDKRPFPSPHGGEFLVELGGFANCDSLAVDAEGWIWVATLMKGGLTAISPDGSEREHYPLPDHFTTNICFGGEGLRDGYVTLSQTGRLVRFRPPRPGLQLAHEI